jgi:hypothetical protein
MRRSWMMPVTGRAVARVAHELAEFRELELLELRARHARGATKLPPLRERDRNSAASSP